MLATAPKNHLICPDDLSCQLSFGQRMIGVWSLFFCLAVIASTVFPQFYQFVHHPSDRDVHIVDSDSASAVGPMDVAETSLALPIPSLTLAIECEDHSQPISFHLFSYIPEHAPPVVS